MKGNKPRPDAGDTRYRNAERRADSNNPLTNVSIGNCRIAIAKSDEEKNKELQVLEG